MNDQKLKKKKKPLDLEVNMLLVNFRRTDFISNRSSLQGLVSQEVVEKNMIDQDLVSGAERESRLWGI